jgi:hypothetical protein
VVEVDCPPALLGFPNHKLQEGTAYSLYGKGAVNQSPIADVKRAVPELPIAHGNPFTLKVPSQVVESPVGHAPLVYGYTDGQEVKLRSSSGYSKATSGIPSFTHNDPILKTDHIPG